MRAWAVIESGKPLQEIELPTPEPTGTQVLLEVTYCGVCHSDLHIWDGYYDVGGGKKMSLKDRGVVLPLARLGADVVTVAHSDLPLAVDLDSSGRDCTGEVTLVPDRRLDGTNVATVPAAAGFCFAYGPGSFGRHRAETARLGLPCRVIHDFRLASDVDVPDDLALVRGRG